MLPLFGKVCHLTHDKKSCFFSLPSVTFEVPNLDKCEKMHATFISGWITGRSVAKVIKPVSEQLLKDDKLDVRQTVRVVHTEQRAFWVI